MLDISEVVLEAAKQRLGPATPVNWRHEDLLAWRPTQRFGLWHDRAVFHFLTDEAHRARYLEVLSDGTEPDGAVIMATFAEDGPEQCSGLPVARYSADQLARALGFLPAANGTPQPLGLTGADTRVDRAKLAVRLPLNCHLPQGAHSGAKTSPCEGGGYLIP